MTSGRLFHLDGTFADWWQKQTGEAVSLLAHYPPRAGPRRSLRRADRLGGLYVLGAQAR
jgi:hypothetical protein